MADDKSLKDNMALLERESVTVTEKLDAANSKLKDVQDIKFELKGPKLFMGRVYPDFKSESPEISNLMGTGSLLCLQKALKSRNQRAKPS